LSLATTSTPEIPHIFIDVAKDLGPILLTHLRNSRVRARIDIVDAGKSHSITSICFANPFALNATSKILRGVDENKNDIESKHGLLHHTQRAAATLHSGNPATTYGGVSLGAASFIDPRCSRMGIRLITSSDAELESLGIANTSLQDVHSLRTLLGLVEGHEAAGLVPHAWGLHLTNSVSFEKGCYLGQELVARSQFRGTIRKRIIPAYITPAGAQARSPSSADPVSAMMVHRTDDALATRSDGVTPGGRGHGRGGAHEKFDAIGFDGISHTLHHRIHAPGKQGYSQHAKNHIRLPFPFLDSSWRANDFLPSTSISLESGAEVDKGARVGKLISHIDGTNLAFILLPIHRLTYIMDSSSNRNNYTDGTKIGDDDCSDSSTAEYFSQLNTRLHNSVPINILISNDKVATHTSDHDHRFRVTPILPMYWRHIPFPSNESTDDDDV
jgi:folate-binding protein YgfZ